MLLILLVGCPDVRASAPLQVAVTTYKGAISTPLDYLVVSALVTSTGSPVSGALVSFADSFGSTFYGSSAITNASGVALTEVQFSSTTTGMDNITATATVGSGGTGSGKTAVDVLPDSSTQLVVTASVVNAGASGGSSNVISGQVAWVHNNWGWDYNAVPQATVTISDSIGSEFPSQTIVTNSGGYYTANFTLGKPSYSVTDLITLTASAATYSGSSSTVELAVNPHSASSLTVGLIVLAPAYYSTNLDYAVVQSKVTTGGTPISGVQVAFSDSQGSEFLGSDATTDATGTATTIVYFSSTNSGLDTITAQASKNGFNSGFGSNTFEVLPYGNTQLNILESLESVNPSAGASDTVSGQVRWLGNNWGWQNNPVGQVSVTITDSLNSFSPIVVDTNSTGQYSSSFPIPEIGVGCTDIVEASANLPGYAGSTSALFLVVASGAGSCAGSTSGSTSTATVTHSQTVTSTSTETIYDQSASINTITQTITQQSYLTTTSTQTNVQLRSLTTTETIVQPSTVTSVYTQNVTASYAATPGGTASFLSADKTSILAVLGLFALGFTGLAVASRKRS